MAKPIHIMIRVLDEARAIDFYRRAFGLDVADRFVFDDFTLVYLRNPEAHFEVELTVNHGRTKPYDHGDSYGHLAVVVDDLAVRNPRVAALRLSDVFDASFVDELERSGFFGNK